MVILVVAVLNLIIIALLAVILLQRSKVQAQAPLDPELSLGDVVNALDRAAVLAEGVALKLQPAADVARAEFSRLVVLLDRLESKIMAGGRSTARIEAAGERLEHDRATIADALAVSDAKVQAVADNLADAQEAARHADPSPTGNQADAAAVNKPPRKRAPRAKP